MRKAVHRVICAVLLAYLSATLCMTHPERTSQESLYIYGEDGGFTVFNDILVLDNGIYIGGCTGTFVNNTWALLKIGANGSLAAAYYGGRGYIMSIASDSLRVYVVGVLTHEALPKTTGFLATFTLNLERIWEKEWRGSPTFSEFKGVYVEAGWLYVAGEADYTGNRGFDIVIQKYSGDGVLAWEKTFAMSGHQEVGSLIVRDGKVYIVGLSTPQDSSEKVDGLVMVYDEKSGLVSTVLWGGAKRDFFKSIEISDAMYVCGFTDSYGEGDLDGLLLKLNLTGGVIWWRTFGGPGDDSFIDLSLYDSRVHVVGHTTEGYSMRPVYLQYSFDGELLGNWTTPVGILSSWTGIHIADGVIHVVGNAVKGPHESKGVYARYVTSYVITVNFPREGLWAALDGENKTGVSVSFESRGVERKLRVSPCTVYGGSRLTFDGWSDGVRDNPRTLRVVGDMVLNATYRVEHYVAVSSEYGEVSGEGWYAEGSTATVSVTPSAVQRLLTVYVFDGWYENGERASSSPVFSFRVTRPVQLRASWRTELSLTLLLILVALLMLLLLVLLLARREGRRRRLPPPPPP